MDPSTYRLFSGSGLAPLTFSEVIFSFTASNNPAYGEQQAVLTWSVNSLYSVTLNNGIGSVSNNSSLSVRHGNNQTITYALTATLGSSIFTSSVNVRFGYCNPVYSCAAYSVADAFSPAVCVEYYQSSTTCYY